jgi:hypothetical protein
MKKTMISLLFALMMCVGVGVANAEKATATVHIDGDFIYNISSTKKMGYITISGRVTKASNGAGLNAAYVTLYDVTGSGIDTINDPNVYSQISALPTPTTGFGYYSFTPVFVNTFGIGVTRSGYQSQYTILIGLVDDTVKDFVMELN